MIEVKKTVIEFCKAEAKAIFLSTKPNINDFNKAYDKMHSFVIKELDSLLGLIKMKKLESDKFYEMNSWVTSINPRNIFKISEYKHAKYDKVWIAYLSGTNPYKNRKIMTNAFFIIQNKNDYLIAKEYIYSNYNSDGYEYTWNELNGYNDLRFDTLGEFIKTERYDEPKNNKDSMKMYLEDK